MTKALDNSLFIALMVMTLTLIPLVAISGITNLVTFLAIIYVALGGFYTGYKIRIRAKATVKS